MPSGDTGNPSIRTNGPERSGRARSTQEVHESGRAATPILIIGCGGFGRECLSTINAINAVEPTWDFLGFVDDVEPPAELLSRMGQARWLGTLDGLESWRGTHAVVGVGSVALRRRLVDLTHSTGLRPATLIHPQASVGLDVVVGEGSVICSHASITTNVRIGRYVQIDQNVAVGHDAVLDDFARVNPGATVSGSVRIGADAVIGTNAAVIQGLSVGRGATVGAGAAVIRDVPPYVTVGGVPTRTLSSTWVGRRVPKGRTRNILVSSAGRRVSLVRLAREAVRSLSPDAIVIGSDSDPEMAPACHEADLSVRVPRLDDPQYLPALRHLALLHDVAVIIPTLDTELLPLAGVRDEWAADGIHVAVSDPAFIRTCRDKTKTVTLFESHGISTPRTLDDDISFPRFIRPRTGSLSSDLHTCQSALQVEDGWWDRSRYLHQELVDRDRFDEYTVDLYYDRSGVLRCAIPRQRLSVRGGEVAKARTVRGSLDRMLTEKLAVIPGARGCLTAQFFVSMAGREGIAQILGIEVNARFGGGYPLTDRAGGHYLLWLVNEYLRDDTVRTVSDWQEGLTMIRYDSEVFLP